MTSVGGREGAICRACCPYRGCAEEVAAPHHEDDLTATVSCPWLLLFGALARLHTLILMRLAIAIDFRMHQMAYMNKKVRLQIWNTAGQER